MTHHQFIDGENTVIPVPCNLVLSENTHDIIPLPTPALFDSIARGGYKNMPYDIIAYRNNEEVAEEEPRDWDAQVPSPQHFNVGPEGYYEWWLPS